jgi:protein-L-isoaspartate(D-aspartate) O-methyltransferase
MDADHGKQPSPPTRLSSPQGTDRPAPGRLIDQLVPGGRLVQPIGLGGAEDVTLFTRSGHDLTRRRSITGARSVPHAHPLEQAPREP